MSDSPKTIKALSDLPPSSEHLPSRDKMRPIWLVRTPGSSTNKIVSSEIAQLAMFLRFLLSTRIGESFNLFSLNNDTKLH